MARALRRSSSVGLMFVMLLAPPAHAVGPLAMLAKQIVQQVVKDFVDSRLRSLTQGPLGPCKPMLAGAPGMQAMDPAMQAQMAQLMPRMMDAQGMQSMDPAARAQVAQMMAMLQSMQNAAPLSGQEVDELVTRIVALSKAMPDQALPCSPEELKVMFSASASTPMASGSLRMMLEQFRAMDQRFREVEETFAKMSEAEQDEAVELMLADAGAMGPEERKQLLGFLQSDLVAFPAAVREKLRARLGAR